MDLSPDAFIRSIYLGDRACKGVALDSWKREFKVQVDCISRVRGETWNYYNDENLEDGFIVFEGVRQFYFDPPGFLPDDAILKFDVGPSDTVGCLTFEMVIAAGREDGFDQMRLVVVAESVALEACDGGERIRK